MLKIKTPLTLVTILSLATSCGNNPQYSNSLNTTPQTEQEIAFSKLECGMEEGLTVAERIKDCGNIEKHLSTGQVMKLVAKKLGQDEILGAEFYQDSETGLIWETENTSDATSREEAQKICREKADLNLRWHLPSANDFLKVGNQKNSQDHNLTVQEVFNNIFVDGSASFWTNSQVPFLKFFNKAVLFKNIQTRVATAEDYNMKKNIILVQCVATEVQ
jgi:hypothetical protein